MKDEVFCPICGNTLNPRTHIMQFGKTKKEIIHIQKKILERILKTFYISIPTEEFFEESIISTAVNKKIKGG